MAFCYRYGVTPQAGIYTAIIAGIFVSLFGGSPVQIAGPTGAFIVLLEAVSSLIMVLMGLQICNHDGWYYAYFNECS